MKSFIGFSSPFPLGRAPPRAQSSRAIFCLCHWTLFNFTEFPNLPIIIHGCLDSLRQSKNSPTNVDDDDAKKKHRNVIQLWCWGGEGGKVSEHGNIVKSSRKKMATKSRAKRKNLFLIAVFVCHVQCVVIKVNLCTLQHEISLCFRPPLSLSVSLLSISCVLTVCTRLLMIACMSSLVCQMNHNLSVEMGRTLRKWNCENDDAIWLWKSTFICLEKSLVNVMRFPWRRRGEKENVSKIDCNTFPYQHRARGSNEPSSLFRFDLFFFLCGWIVFSTGNARFKCLPMLMLAGFADDGDSLCVDAVIYRASESQTEKMCFVSMTFRP